MLINLMAINENEDLIIDLPYMKFSNHFVTLSELLIEWTEPVQVYGYISSTLVDRNAFNPKQQIFHINKQSGSNYTFIAPTPFLEYKIQCLDLESSVFKIHIYDKDKNKIKNSIKGVYLTLVITDARIQYIYSRKTN